jgi:anthranilate 1,2-dioxygenase small subunit
MAVDGHVGENVNLKNYAGKEAIQINFQSVEGRQILHQLVARADVSNLFTEDGVYEIVPKENADLGLPIGILHCFGRRMMRDRIVALRRANVFEPHTYRHMTSGLEFRQLDADTLKMQSNYVVIQTLTDGESRIFQAGRYFDRVMHTADGWRYQCKRAVYDRLACRPLLVTPV